MSAPQSRDMELFVSIANADEGEAKAIFEAVLTAVREATKPIQSRTTIVALFDRHGGNPS